MKLLSLIITFLFTNFLFSQKIVPFNYNYKFEYEFNFRKDSLKENYTTALMTLYTNNNESIFQDSKKNKIDSILFSPKRPAIIDLSINEGKKIDFVIRKAHNSNQLIYSELIYIDNLGYTEKTNLFNWKILKEMKHIAGYSCTKAISEFRGRSYIAWFTNEIPLNDGPYKFNGLPGLILEVSDTKNNFLFSIKNIKKEDGIVYYNSSIITTDRKKIMPAKLNYYYSMTMNRQENIVYNPIELK